MSFDSYEHTRVWVIVSQFVQHNDFCSTLPSENKNTQKRLQATSRKSIGTQRHSTHPITPVGDWEGREGYYGIKKPQPFSTGASCHSLLCHHPSQEDNRSSNKEKLENSGDVVYHNTEKNETDDPSGELLK